MNADSADQASLRISGSRLLGLPRRVHAVAWAGLLVLVLLLLGISRHYQGRNFWQGWTEAYGLRHPGYAERIYAEDFFRTRANAWSNLAYVLVGFYALALAAGDRRNRPSRAGGYVTQTPALSVLFGLACCYLGFGSGLFHASLTRWGQQLDVAAMYAPLLACIAMYLGRWGREAKGRWGFPVAPLWPWLTGLAVVVSYLLYRYKWSMSAFVVLTTLIVTVSLLGLLDVFFARHRMRFRWLGWSTALLVAAIACRQLDVAGKFSGPDAWYQGHALWHLLTALSLGCLYGYHRSEVAAVPSP